MKIDKTKLKATPEVEDFGHKYTDEGSGKIGAKLLDGYFNAVKNLLSTNGVSKKKNLKVIELGCGEGYSTERLRSMLPKDADMMASEYVESLLPQAKKLNPGMKVVQESVYELQHKDNTFDVIFLLEVLEHLDYPDVALAEVSRVLKKDGVLILGVPREPIWSFLNLMRGKYITRLGNTIGHLNHWSKITLVRYLSGKGYTVTDTRSPLPWTVTLNKKK